MTTIEELVNYGDKSLTDCGRDLTLKAAAELSALQKENARLNAELTAEHELVKSLREQAPTI